MPRPLKTLWYWPRRTLATRRRARISMRRMRASIPGGRGLEVGDWRLEVGVMSLENVGRLVDELERDAGLGREALAEGADAGGLGGVVGAEDEVHARLLREHAGEHAALTGDVGVGAEAAGLVHVVRHATAAGDDGDAAARLRVLVRLDLDAQLARGPLDEVGKGAIAGADDAGLATVVVAEGAVDADTQQVCQNPAVADVGRAVEGGVGAEQRDAGELQRPQLLIAQVVVDVVPGGVVDDEELGTGLRRAEDRGQGGVHGDGELRDAGLARIQEEAVGIGLRLAVAGGVQVGVEPGHHLGERCVCVHGGSVGKGGARGEARAEARTPSRMVQSPYGAGMGESVTIGNIWTPPGSDAPASRWSSCRCCWGCTSSGAYGRRSFRSCWALRLRTSSRRRGLSSPFGFPS